MLDVGSPVPDIELEDTEGNLVRLRELGAGQPVLVYFMRAINCAQCNAHVRMLTSQAGDFAAKGVRVVVSVPDSRADAAAWKARKKVPFAVLTGERGAAHAEFGLLRKIFGAVQQSGTALIDAGGVVAYIHGGTNPSASYDREATALAVSKLLPAA